MRRGVFEHSARELSLDRKHWDRVYKAIRTKDALTRLIYEVDAQNKPALIAVCRIYGSAGQGQVLVKHKTVRVRIPLSWRITLSEEQPENPKLISISLKEGEKGVHIEDALAEYLKDFYTDPLKRAEATASLIVARRSQIGTEAMEELFWAGIFYAKRHPDNVVIEEKEPEPERPPNPGLWT